MTASTETANRNRSGRLAEVALPATGVVVGILLILGPFLATVIRSALYWEPDGANALTGIHRGKQAVGTVTARPARGRLSSTGAIHLAAGSKLSHHGKWVTAELGLRVPASLAGETLRVDVMAVDRQGHTQVERDAATIRVA